nr:hypothetical protein MFLOJ_54500 [Mycobacterium florentinum]
MPWGDRDALRPPTPVENEHRVGSAVLTLLDQCVFRAKGAVCMTVSGADGGLSGRRLLGNARITDLLTAKQIEEVAP